MSIKKKHLKYFCAILALILVSDFFFAQITSTSIPDFFNTTNLGYEILENNTYVHLWNSYHSYYFNRMDGVGLTNNYKQPWTRHILTFGYFEANETTNYSTWTELYRIDQTTDYNESITGVTNSYINFTLQHQLNVTNEILPDHIGGHITWDNMSFLLNMTYHLGINDTALSVICTTKNIGPDGKKNFAFGWIIDNITVDNNENDNYILFKLRDNSTRLFNLHTPGINEHYTDGDMKNEFWLERGNANVHKSWLPTQPYYLTIESDPSQYNAIVTIYTIMGNIGPDESKSTLFQWVDAGQIPTINVVNSSNVIDLYDKSQLSDYGTSYLSSVWHIPRYSLNVQRLLIHHINEIKVPSIVYKQFYFGWFASNVPVSGIQFYGINVYNFKRVPLTFTLLRSGDYSYTTSEIRTYDVILVVLNPSYLDNSNTFFNLLYKGDASSGIDV